MRALQVSESFFCGKHEVHPGHNWIYGGKLLWCEGLTEVHPNERRTIKPGICKRCNTIFNRTTPKDYCSERCLIAARKRRVAKYKTRKKDAA